MMEWNDGMEWNAGMAWNNSGLASGYARYDGKKIYLFNYYLLANSKQKIKKNLYKSIIIQLKPYSNIQ